MRQSKKNSDSAFISRDKAASLRLASSRDCTNSTPTLQCRRRIFLVFLFFSRLSEQRGPEREREREKQRRLRAECHRVSSSPVRFYNVRVASARNFPSRWGSRYRANSFYARYSRRRSRPRLTYIPYTANNANVRHVRFELRVRRIKINAGFIYERARGSLRLSGRRAAR